MQSVQAEPGAEEDEAMDLDPRKTNGQSLPVRMVHRVSSARATARPAKAGPSSCRATAARMRDQSASSAAMRFTRFFNNTPMAIASVDGNGRILRTNAPFLKLFSGLVSQDDVEPAAH